MNIKNKQWKTFKTILFFLFLVFLINHYYINNGYYENKINEKTKITQENINKFEKDIKNNKYIDLKKYNEKEYKNTNNITSKLGYKISENISNIITKNTKEIYNFLKRLFN